MKEQILAILIATFGLMLFSSQQIQEESIVINVEVPARVFKGNTIVDSLTIEDFEVYEDGKLQKIEAVYLIKKKSIERKEEKKRFAPQTARNFFLWFEISEYMPRLREAIDYFFDNVFFPGDNLIVITPLKTYNLKDQALKVKSREEVADKLIGIIRKDTTAGNSEYRASLRELREIINVIEGKAGEEARTTQEIEDLNSGFYNVGSLEEIVLMYSSILKKLENLRGINQQKLLDFAKSLKNKEGQKHIFLFYQRELLPQLHPNTLNKFMSQYQDKPALQFALSDLFDTYKRDISIDVEKVKQAFADSSLSIHFLFLKKMKGYIPGLQMQERSEDIYVAFKQMAEATGGLVESSANPAFAFKRACEALENYYLLYYSPENYKRDGKFRKIKVRVKNKNFTITHRAGYFAN